MRKEKRAFYVTAEDIGDKMAVRRVRKKGERGLHGGLHGGLHRGLYRGLHGRLNGGLNGIGNEGAGKKRDKRR